MITLPTKVLPDIYPKVWTKQLDNGQKLDVLQFRNLQHFKSHVKNMKPNKDGASHEQPIAFDTALEDLIKGVGVIDKKQYEIIKDEVRSVLHKRGLISENVYEGYQYDTDGQIIDIAKYIEGNPECMLKPKVSYQNHFYEIYINMAYLGGVSNTALMTGLSKILATIQLLEQEKIFIKVSIAAASKDTVQGERTLCVLLPLFSHRDEKTIEEMSSVLNDRFFRTFIFGIREAMYGSKLYSGYGVTIDLKETITPHNIDVAVLAQNILDKTITPGTR